MAVINDRFLRKIKLKTQGAVSTSDIAEFFIAPELYNKIYCGWGVGNKKPAKLSDDEVRAVSFALTAMANTLMGAAAYLPTQRKRKGE
jgi:hypothetical protein